MIQLLGSVLVAAGAAYLGFSAAAQLRKQVRVLDDLAAGLGLLEQELELAAPELGRLMERLSRRTRGVAHKLFSSYAQALARLEDASAAQLWEKATAELEELVPEGKQCLSALGEVLGRYDSREQRACVAAVRQRLEAVRTEAERQCRVRGRTCQTIGLSGGAFLVILLL